MKTIWIIVAFLASALQVFAESNLTPTEPRVISRGAHEQVWQYTTVDTDPFGKVYTNRHTYVQIATGLNQFDAIQNKWVPASGAFEIDQVNGGAVASSAQHKLRLAANANNFTGALELTTPDQKRLVMQCIGLALTDQTGKSVFIAEIKDSTGQLVDQNTVIYPDAFNGVHADIRVQMHLSGIEHDIILKDQITSAFVESYGLDPTSARFQIWHQVLTSPEVTKRVGFISRPSGMVETDDTVLMGKMGVVPGYAFNSLRKPNQLNLDSLGIIAVAKEWVQIQGVDFLVESIPFLELQPHLQDLPVVQAANIQPEQLKKAFASINVKSRSKPLSFKKRTISRQKSKMFAALDKGATAQNGFVIDYQIENTSQTNFTFRGDTTYFITGTVSLWGKTVLEPETVIKFTNYNTVNIPQVLVNGDFDCRTLPWAPAIFTAKDDNTVGEIITGSTGTPLTTSFYALFPLSFRTSTNTVNLHDFQSRFHNVGMGFSRSGLHNVWNGQIYNCDRGLESGVGNLNARNILLYKTRYAFNTTGNPTNSVYAEHLTIDTAQRLFLLNTNNSYLYLTNSLTCNITNDNGAHVISNSVQYVDSSQFTKIGGGYHYLPWSSSLRDSGTTNISSEMRALLNKMTTYPPTALTNDFDVDTVLSPFAMRDTDLPDLGYHYPPVDYIWGDLTVTNATLLLTNGVSVALHGQLGTLLVDNSRFISSGYAERMNTFSRYENFQELPTADLSLPDASSLSLIYVMAPNSDPDIQFQFTRGGFPANVEARRLFLVTASDDDALGTFELKDSQFIHSEFYFQTTSSPPSMEVKIANNLFEYSTLIFVQDNAGYSPFPISYSNNLFRNGNFYVLYGSTNTSWSFIDNLFDSAITFTNGFALSAQNNAYFSTTGLGGSNNKVIATLDFTSGPLGSYYYPTSGTNLYTLVNAGSRGADAAGLYHYTTLIDQTKETNSVVDIGFHYVAADDSNAPVDSDADGIHDYLEDRNGDGAKQSIETDWNDPDTDYDGRSDSAELVDGTDGTDPNSFNESSLGTFLFEQTDLGTEESDLPSLNSGNQLVTYTDYDGYSTLSTASSTNRLVYPSDRKGGGGLVNLRTGTLRFWFKPSWSSMKRGGTGPGTEAILAESGLPEDNYSEGRWSFVVSPDGNQILFKTSNELTTTTNLVAPADLVAGEWRHICLAYSPTSSALYIGDRQVATGSGVDKYPDKPLRESAGLAVSNNRLGTTPIGGEIDTLETFNYPLFSAQASCHLPVGVNIISREKTQNPTVITEPATFPQEPATIGQAAKYFISWRYLEGRVVLWGNSVQRPVVQQVGVTLESLHYVGTLNYDMWGVNSPSSGSFTTSADQQGALYGVNYTATGSTRLSLGAGGIWAATSCEYENLVVDHLDYAGNLYAMPQSRLRRWPFDITTTSESGDIAKKVHSFNFNITPALFGNGLLINGESCAPSYNILQNDGNVLVKRNHGTISFWFRPNWNSGNSGAAENYLLDFRPRGSFQHRFSLFFSQNGSKLKLFSADETGNGVAHFEPDVSFNENAWHLITITYDASQTCLYIDGAPIVSAGLAITYAASVMDSMFVGCDYNGGKLANGTFDELTSYSYPLTSSEVYALYSNASAIDSDLDGLTNLQEIALGTKTDDPDTDSDGFADSVDAFPNDPLRWNINPNSNPGDTITPTVKLLYPSSAVVQP